MANTTIDQFDPSVNTSYGAQHDLQSNLISDIAGGTVATVADFGATVWNSLPFTTEVDTADLLSNISDNALRVYEENPDFVHAASFIGGMFVPAGLAMKGMGALRAGAKGASWFSDAGKATKLTELDTLFAQGSEATASYRAARNSLLARGVANNVLDSYAVEAAVIGTMNAHPMMEDYMKDPVSNFLLWGGIGGVIGGGIGLIGDNYLTKSAAGKIASQAFDTATGEYITVPQASMGVTKLQIRNSNIKNLETLSTNESLNPVTKEIVSDILLKEKTLQAEDLLAMSKNSLVEAEKPVQNEILKRLIENPKFASVDSVDFLRLSESSVIPSKAAAPLDSEISVGLSENAKGNLTATKVVYYPEFDAATSVANAANYARASTLNITPAKLGTTISANHLAIPQVDNALLLGTKQTAEVDKLYLDTLAAVDTVSLSKLQKADIAVDDIPTQQAVLARIRKLANENAEIPDVKVGGTVMSPVDLYNHLAKQKSNLIADLSTEGIPAETISIRTNTPVDTVKAFIVSGDETLSHDHGPMISYSSTADISEALNPARRPLVLQSNVNKQNYAKFSASLDQRATMNMNAEIVDTTLQVSPSFTAQNFRSSFLGQNYQLFDILRSQVSNAVNQKAGNKFITSTDFYVRDMGDFGKIATYLGKKVQNIANDTEKKLLTPVTEAMNIVAKDQVALLEFNTALAHNAELAGHRLYKNGQFWQEKRVINAEGKEVSVLTPTEFQGKEYKIVTESVKALMEKLNNSGRELYDLKNTINKLLGKPDLKDLGFWVPAFNPKGKHISYVWNKLNDTTRILWGNTAEELTKAEQVYKAQFGEQIAKGDILVVPKSQQELYNTLQGRTDTLTMDIANVERLHSGASAPAIVKFNTDVFGEIAGGYQHYINSHVKQLAEISMHDVTDVLDRMSSFNLKYFENQPLGILGKLGKKPEDAAIIMKNTLLGNSNLHEYSNWKNVNQSFETAMNWGLSHLQSIWKEVSKPVGFLRKDKGIDYETLAKKSEEAGIVNPYAIFDDAIARDVFNVAKLQEAKNISPRLIHASNALAATVALRFGELAQPLVNAMSLPILTTASVLDRMPETFLGVRKGTAKVNPVAVMYDGARAMNSPLFKRLSDQWEAAGYYTPFVSEATEVLKKSRAFEPGVLTKVEAAVESNLVNWMSKAADSSESLVRKMTMHTGAVLAKKLYPELDDLGVTIFARDFMDKAVGNYHASQRPVFFQGTLGTAMGLFQTYMLTLGQSIYRQLELKNYKALGATMLAQSTIFGAGSLPGFHFVSEKIGEHFSDDNVDLTTGTFKALGDPVASLLLYGLPSNLGPAFYTRGDISPRIPTGLGSLPQVSMLTQTLGAASNVLGALGSGGYKDVSRAMGEALSMQSMSRPIARLSELATGYSVTQQGNTVTTPEEVWTATGIISRILGTRPLEEAKLREAIHLDHLYKSIDHDERQKVTAELKTAIRTGDLTDEKLSRLAEEYMRTGTPQGWRAARNQAIGQTEVSGKATLLQKLHPNHPLNYMIDQMDGV